jgi:starvation-inducible outer membrane lipoprotein
MALDRFQQYTSLWKVKETVEKVPAIAEWRQSEIFKRHEKASIEWYANNAVPEDKPEP